MTVGQAFLADYRKLRDLLSHKLPSGTAEDVLHHAVKLAIEHQLKQRLGSGHKAPREPNPDSRRPSTDLRRETWLDASGRCAYVGPDGRRCDSTWQLEDDHIRAYARGGRTKRSNLRRLCRAHNRLAAEHTFGADFITARIPK
jgi:5-methylcytosine-specific restriction endonuclease McrA